MPSRWPLESGAVQFDAAVALLPLVGMEGRFAGRFAVIVAVGQADKGHGEAAGKGEIDFPDGGSIANPFRKREVAAAFGGDDPPGANSPAPHIAMSIG